jgi:hypothetical protein
MSSILPKVIHIHSDILNMDLKMNTKSFNILTDDKVLYNHNEWVLLSQNGLEVDRQIHDIKKVFGGDIWGVMTEKKLTEFAKNTAESLDKIQSNDSEKLQQIGQKAESGQSDGESETGLKIGQVVEATLF